MLFHVAFLCVQISTVLRLFYVAARINQLFSFQTGSDDEEEENDGDDDMPISRSVDRKKGKIKKDLGEFLVCITQGVFL